jgi:hypothetical protein
MTEIRPLFTDKQPGPMVEDIGPTYVEMARTIAAICSTRILLLIAVLTGAGIWAFTIWQPDTPRLYAAVAFSLVFVLPQVALYWKRG